MNFVSLFSGCGGFDLGFMEQGFRPLAAYDVDKTACDNYKANVDRVIETVDLRNGIPNEKKFRGADVVIAGPPCQGFSTAGKRLVHDERNHLLTMTGELALRILPKVLVVENVPGVLAGKHALYWNQMDSLLREAGYRTKTVCYQASDLGMAQLRKRVLLFAWRTRKDIDFSFPELTGGNLRSVLNGVWGEANHDPKRLKPDTRDWVIATKIRPGQKLSNVRGGMNAVATWEIPEVFGHVTPHEKTVLELLRRLRRQDRQRNFGDADPVSFARLKAALGDKFNLLVQSLLAKGYLRKVEGGVDLVGTFNGKYRRQDWNSPCSTVDTRFGSPRYFLHPKYHRGFTVREAARIQGFKDHYIFQGSEQAQYRVIGNAVPPPLGNVAAQIAKRLLGVS